jgi:hypothetical protein
MQETQSMNKEFLGTQSNPSQDIILRFDGLQHYKLAFNSQLHQSLLTIFYII